jgi:radical SAM protein with 4Fe4S-binding SPASM domain
MTPGRVLRIAEEFKEMGGLYVRLSGGEPIIHPEFHKILDNLNYVGYKPTVYTTGVQHRMKPLSSEDVDALKPKVGKMVFSLHGGNAEIHDKITNRKGSFDLTFKSMWECKRASMDVEVHFVPMLENFHSLSELFPKLTELYIDNISLLRFVPHGRGDECFADAKFTKHDLVELRDIVKEGRKLLWVKVGAPFNILGLEFSEKCSAGKKSLTITVDGRAYPCDAFKDYPTNLSVGNVFFDGLKNTWETSPFLNRIREVGQQECDKCNRCRLCQCGCMAQKCYKLGKLNNVIPDPMCLRYLKR